MKKQKENIIKFAENSAFAYDPYKKKEKLLKLFKYQEKLLIDLEKNKFTIIKQSRQVGIDIAMAIYIAYFLLYNDNKSVLVISESNESAIDFLNKVRKILYYIETIPDINNKKNIQLKNGSRILTTGYSSNIGRGFSCDLVYINNFEYMKDSKVAHITLIPTICRTNSKYIISSTPKYKKDFFHKLWTDAVDKKNDFKPINISWKQNPNFDDVWYEKMCKHLNYDKNSIATELDGKFIEKKEKKKKSSINIRLEQDKKQKILTMMKQKNISSITDYIMELIDKDLNSFN